MNFNTHPELAGLHSYLSASKYHWIGYDQEKFETSIRTMMMAAEGTELHDLAAKLIRKRIKLPENQKTLNMYVNDAIGFRMQPELTLFYSANAFGTVDAISFGGDLLRIHDLKTGVTKCSMNQLYIYAAYFSLEYGVKPHTIRTELRIYQNDYIQVEEADPDKVVDIMDKIIFFDKIIDRVREENKA